MSLDPAPRVPPPKVRYRFGAFTLSTARRTLTRDGDELPLIPRYFDLLALLLRRRHEAVHRREILEAVWSDVVVSDGALSQAIRTLRRALGDDTREPLYIRTVSRHGCRFVHTDVIEEPEDGPAQPGQTPSRQRPPDAAGTRPGSAASDRVPGDEAIDGALERLLSACASGRAGDEESREAAETLHALGTGEALRRLDRRRGHEAARALLRETRWNVPGAGPVPLLGVPGGAKAIRLLALIRLRLAASVAGARWAAAAWGGALAGTVAGLLGGLALTLAAGGDSPAEMPLALALVGALLGAVGGAGVGAGLAAAEALARSRRGAALVACGALGGGGIGALAHLLARWTLEDLFGRDLSAVGGGLEGLVLGAAAGLGYALATPRPEGGMAAPRGAARARAALVTGLACAAAAVVLSAMGRSLGGASLDLMARSFPGSRVDLAPLARLVGEPQVGPLTRALLGGYEGLLFGAGLVMGLTRRPRRALGLGRGGGYP